MTENEHYLPEVLSSYTFGRFTRKDKRRIEEHLLACPSCKQYVSDILQAQIDLIKRNYKPIPAPPDWQEKLLDTLMDSYRDKLGGVDA